MYKENTVKLKYSISHLTFKKNITLYIIFGVGIFSGWKVGKTGSISIVEMN